jgi:lipopolysaccharide biosynthesis glycosyltransferase
MSVLDVSCAARGAYVPHSAAMLHSLLAAAGRHELRVHYLHGPELRARDRRRLEGMVRAHGGTIAFLEVGPERVAGLPVSGYFTEAMWYRIFLPELAPEADRVLYLDVDTIAVDDIAPLWDVSLEGALVGAVTNVFEAWREERRAELPEGYFNSGVLLLHLTAMRADGTTERLRRFALEHPDLLWPDQDTLNLVLGERRVHLHPRWNAMNSVLLFDNAGDYFDAATLREARERPAIRHFEGPGPNKPWEKGASVPHGDAYFAHRAATPYRLGRLARLRQALTPMRPV